MYPGGGGFVEPTTEIYVSDGVIKRGRGKLYAVDDVLQEVHIVRIAQREALEKDWSDRR